MILNEFFNLTQVFEKDMTEGVMSEIDAELRDIVAREDFDALYELFSANTPAGRYVQDMYDDIVIDTGLHPDDDFERIEQIVFDRLADDFGEQGVAEGSDTDTFSVADKVEDLVNQYKLFDKRGWTDLFAKLAGRKLAGEEIYREMEYASKFLQLLDSIRMRSNYRGKQNPKLDQELIDLSNQWLSLFNKATSEFKGMGGQGVAEGKDDYVPPQEANYDDKYQAMVRRVGEKARAQEKAKQQQQPKAPVRESRLALLKQIIQS